MCIRWYQLQENDGGRLSGRSYQRARQLLTTVEKSLDSVENSRGRLAFEAPSFILTRCSGEDYRFADEVSSISRLIDSTMMGTRIVSPSRVRWSLSLR